MKFKKILLISELSIVVLFITFIALFVIAMSCPSCTEPNLAFPAEIIISLSIIISCVNLFFILIDISYNHHRILITFASIYSIIFIIGVIPNQYWISEYYINDFFKSLSYKIQYPYFGISNLAIGIILLLSKLKDKSLSILFIVAPRILIGLYFIFIKGELFLSVFFIFLSELLYIYFQKNNNISNKLQNSI